MIIKGDKNDFVALAKTLGIHLRLNGQVLIFDSEDDLIEHHR